MRDGEIPVGLDAYGLQRPAIAKAGFGLKRAHEAGRAQRTQEKAWNANIFKPHRRQVHFGYRAYEGAGADLVDLKPRKAVVFAVTFHFAIIDVIVAEGAHVEAAERALLIAAN